MRVAIVSDIHGNITALEAVIADVDAQSPDLIVHGGDLCVIGPRPAEVIDVIRERGWPGVLGNTDEITFDSSAQAEQKRKAPKLRDWLSILFETLNPWAQARLGEDRIEWLRGLPREWRCGDLVVMHASPGDLWRSPMPDASDAELLHEYGDTDANLVVYGHIHRAFVRSLEKLTVANSGSVGLPYDGDWRSSYILVDDGVPSIRRVEYDRGRAKRELAGAGFPLAAWLADIEQHGRFRPPE